MNKKTIWITGGSTGIGKALAIKFANEGWNVAISARRENLLNEISHENENIHGYPLDVTDKTKCKEVFEQIKSKFSRLAEAATIQPSFANFKAKALPIPELAPVIQITFLSSIN